MKLPSLCAAESSCWTLLAGFPGASDRVGRSRAWCAFHDIGVAICATFWHLQKRWLDLEEVMERSRCVLGLLEAHVKELSEQLSVPFSNSLCRAGPDLHFSQVFVSCP